MKPMAGIINQEGVWPQFCLENIYNRIISLPITSTVDLKYLFEQEYEYHRVREYFSEFVRTFNEW